VVEPPHHRQPPLPRRLLCGESRFAAHSNRLLQQNRHKAALHVLAYNLTRVMNIIGISVQDASQ